MEIFDQLHDPVMIQIAVVSKNLGIVLNPLPCGIGGCFLRDRPQTAEAFG